MPTSMFKIYDGRTSFWQWDTKQKLIVLDEEVTEVHFSSRNMKHSITRDVYEFEGKRVCNVPDITLQLPRNLVAYACVDGATKKAVKFAVIERPVPDDYVMEKEEDIDEKFAEIDVAIEQLNERKADNIIYNEVEQYVQLTANGEPIGDKVEFASGVECSITDCKITEDGHLVVTLSNGKIIDAGYVGATEGVTFTPHISDNLILSWTNNGGLENPDPVDLNPFDEWIDDDNEMSSSDYIWEDE